MSYSFLSRLGFPSRSDQLSETTLGSPPPGFGPGSRVVDFGEPWA